MESDLLWHFCSRDVETVVILMSTIFGHVGDWLF
jgi:hypothetical protein